MNLKLESQRSLNRILNRLDIEQLSKVDQRLFKKRLEQHFPSLFENLVEIYQSRYDLHYQIEQLVSALLASFKQRSRALKNRDKKRLANPLWHQSEKMLGMACYVDLVAKDLDDLATKVDYYQDLGITYLHLMPLYKSPEGDSDGGYAVSDYRCVNPELGTIKSLNNLAKILDKAGISLVLDFVFNHTSDEHDWAVKARQGELDYCDYYYFFDDKTIPNQYENHLREIFPQVRRGSFTYLEDIDRWVWTTFNSFQWDLNYSNPSVFNAIVGEMLFLANLGCDALRLDALAFIWKDMGTDCENRPKAHLLIQAFNTCLKIAAPSVVFKSEAIVHPDEVAKYIKPEECQLSYNPLLMALIWNSLATRKTRLLNQSLSHRFEIDENCTWVNYARCHDDIGWTFDDADAGRVGINGYDHRLFLNQFYTGQFEGSFASGMGFGYNPENGDCRVCGSLASLAGLEQGLAENDAHLIENAIARILLIHHILLSIGGIPLLYAGDELAMLNDYRFLEDEHKKHDARWVNRPLIEAKHIKQAHQSGTVQNKVWGGLKHAISLRKHYAVFGQAKTQILPTTNPHIFAYQRQNESDMAICIYNFSEHSQQVIPDILVGLSQFEQTTDLISGDKLAIQFNHNFEMAPYQSLWLLADC
ncbi:amylosucrase [Catenovulum adriaticum]|uniref:Alpha-amylase family glycosyl hydrolase n=1 Tax=Catenovulum adriaticum TaxID=2984846 RepID=A0ABY7ATH4_9ALTE|nr:amylosucrase [Catenovulum sp. TS8]WAJ71956.1 alpha-amylase family glycosyl hydrolase [Catenovulum sp. TS8]